MKHCIRCGRKLSSEKRICYKCLDAWKNKRTRAWNQVISEFGKPTKETLDMMKKRLRELEK